MVRIRAVRLFIAISCLCILNVVMMGTVFAQSSVSFIEAIPIATVIETPAEQSNTCEVSFVDCAVVADTASEAASEDTASEEKTKTYIGTFTATAYDTCCGTRTATGVNLKGKSLEEARVIAVDPKVIPLNTTVYVEFPAPYEYLSGEYLAADTGGAIKGNIIDLFWGDYGTGVHDQSIWQFGRRTGVKIYSLT